MSSSTNSAPNQASGPSSNPLFGCAILIIMLCTFGGMVAWVLYSGYKQDKEIDKFTVNEAVPFSQLEVTESQKDALKQKIATFDAAVKEGKDTELALTIEELNQLLVIAQEAEVEDYREMVRFTKFRPEDKVIEANLHWPMNKLSLDENVKRYLVGNADFLLYLNDSKSLEMLILEVRVPGKEISKGFLGALRQWPWLNVAKTKAPIAEALKKITEIDFSPDGQILILRAKAA